MCLQLAHVPAYTPGSFYDHFFPACHASSAAIPADAEIGYPRYEGKAGTYWLPLKHIHEAEPTVGHGLIYES